MVVLLLLLYRTRLGLATRAVSQQPIAAELCGISITRVNVLTFVITGVVGGIAGAMTGAAIGMLSPLLSLPLTVKGLIVTVIGGLGSIPGAIIAGLVVGGLENFFQFFRGVSERDLYIMLLLFAFLVFRPGGLFAIAGRTRLTESAAMDFYLGLIADHRRSHAARAVGLLRAAHRPGQPRAGRLLRDRRLCRRHAHGARAMAAGAGARRVARSSPARWPARSGFRPCA